MSALFDWLFGQYATYSTGFIVLELIAVVFGIASVLLARKTNILVYPVGLISTGIFVYLLWNWQLFGDMLINAYYSAMSLYGWYNWSKSRSSDQSDAVEIERIESRDIPIMLTLAGISAAFVGIVYYLRPVINNGFSFSGAELGLHLFTWVDYTDMFTTALFLIAMYLMASRKIENWLVWIVADAISVPLYFYKGYTFTSLQYVVFTLIAIGAYYEWKRRLRLQSQSATA
ncbi:MAG: nicotinamide riboside transporter PnuC [Psychrobacter sp.]|nr:nicotinamide riboside transporter PnuC [Psychrobacter sp.]